MFWAESTKTARNPFKVFILFCTWFIGFLKLLLYSFWKPARKFLPTDWIFNSIWTLQNASRGSLSHGLGPNSNQHFQSQCSGTWTAAQITHKILHVQIQLGNIFLVFSMPKFLGGRILRLRDRITHKVIS